MRPGTTPTAEESQGGDTILVKPLAIKGPQHPRLPLDITSALEPSPEASPEPTEVPASGVLVSQTPSILTNQRGMTKR
jgi:hypothetical protein